ncbi:MULTISPECIES: o-succinylbenzoate synthase [unclassified Frigoribacterium]|jgi:O-succinylbenzoate synthase|uniref:o-succinylbenzoate synthase n=1 Tax=unclassified Frigoribacterium TaxID=2627005 RepID=UPI0006F6C089|nr:MULTISPECIES: o-succinylbenzoate synthase [unclassified Frigoribacterium]KQM25705.1 O-succinylbenzoate synthase [Frigoribacterium sp. Leaf8]
MPTVDRAPSTTPPLPPLADLVEGAHVVRLPLRTRFRGLDAREALVVEGPSGWTEFSPFVEYGPAEAAAWLAATIDFGWGRLPEGGARRVAVNATLPAVAADRVPDVLARYRGCRTVKVKVAERGQTLADDIARVAAARDWVGPEGRVRVDANGGWSVESAEEALVGMAPYALEYAEQPCATVPELAELRRRVSGTGVLVAADESVRKADDPLAVARAGAADLLVIKAQPLGGVTAALRIVAAAGLPVVVSSALDTSVGLSMGAHLAAAVPGLRHDCGLGTAALLGADVTRDPLLPVDGEIDVRRVEVDVDLLRRHAVDDDRREVWLERLRASYAVLAG